MLISLADFSNHNKDVFLVSIDKMIDRGALMSRYSRSSELDIREVYKHEFKDNPNRGRNFYRRIFSEYGDESIAELVTAQVGIQNISNIASKYIEENRIGLSYLEKSSRYVEYDAKKNGEYLYLKGESLGFSGSISERYEEYCDTLFQTYSDYREKVYLHLEKMFPFEKFSEEYPPEESDALLKKAYTRALKSRVLDEIRSLLPSSTLTNLGVSGNGRAFHHLIIKLYNSELPELQRIGEELFLELKKELPELIDDVNSQHSVSLANYLKERDRETCATLTSYDGHLVSLRNYLPEREALARVYEARNFLLDCNKVQAAHERDDGSFVLRDSFIRNNRRDKPGRWYEFVPYTFIINTNYGAFRELQRHRMLSIVRRKLTPLYGYDIPPIIRSIPELRERFTSIMDRALSIWKMIKNTNGESVAQYTVPFGYRYPVILHANLRELCYFVELRSTPQAHYDLRMIAQDIYGSIKRVHPTLSKIIKFVDLHDYPLGRMRSEIKKERKRRMSE